MHGFDFTEEMQLKSPATVRSLSWRLSWGGVKWGILRRRRPGTLWVGAERTILMAKQEKGRARGVGLDVRLVRVVRTQSSEVFILWQDDVRLGQVDIHYGFDIINATLILEKDLDPDQQADLVDLIDQDVVSSHLPQFAREDFLVTVFRGTELESFSDGEPEVEDEDESEEY
jgi:hypothetical protein